MGMDELKLNGMSKSGNDSSIVKHFVFETESCFNYWIQEVEEVSGNKGSIEKCVED